MDEHGQPQASASAPAGHVENTPETHTPQASAPKKLIVAIVAALVVVGGLAFLFLSPASPLNTTTIPAGPKLLAGQIPYVYACGLVDVESVGKALDFDTDKNKLAVEETYAFAPGNSKDKQLDLIKLVDAHEKEDKKATSSCTLKFDRTFSIDATGKKQATYINVTLTADQFASEKEAKEDFTSARPASAKQFGDFGNSGYVAPPAALSRSSSVKYVVATFLHKNVVFTLQAPVKSNDTTGQAVTAKLATVAKTVTGRAGQGIALKPKNFSGANKIGQNPLLDACASIDYVKVSQALGRQSELRPTGVLADKTLAPDDFEGTRPKAIESSCGFSFRTEDDRAALAKAENNAKAKGPPPLPGGDEPLNLEDMNATTVLTMPYERKFPHLLDIRYFTTASSDDAKTLVKKVKEDVQKTNSPDDKQKYEIKDTTLGDGGLRISTDTQAQAAVDAQAQGLEGEGSPPYYETTVYYTAKGPYVYMVTAFFVRQDQPYPTTSLKLIDENMKPLSKVIEAGIKAGQKQAK